MFLLYAVVIGVVLAVVSSGRLERLADLRFRAGWLVALGFLVQIVLFLGPVSERVGDAGPSLYVASTAAVFVAVVLNVRLPGMILIAVGAAANLAAILANGGFMPADPAALAVLGHPINPGYSNSALVATSALWILTDVFALPRGLPLANVFSIGDVLIGAGVVAVIVLASHHRPPAAAADTDLAAVPPGNSPERRPGTVPPGHGARPFVRLASDTRMRVILRSMIRPGQTRRETGTQSQGSSESTSSDR